MDRVIRVLGIVLGLLAMGQASVLYIQHRINRGFRCLIWWTLGATLQAIGYSLFIFLQFESMYFITYFGFPLVVAGQIYIFKGILVFLERKYNRLALMFSYLIFSFAYLYYSIVVDNIVIRSVIVALMISMILGMSAFRLFTDRNKSYKLTANYVALIYGIHFIFLLIYAIDILIITNNTSYESFRVSVFRIIAYVVPIISSTLTIYGLIMMVNQCLNAENNLLVKQLELEKSRAEKDAMTDGLTGLMNRRYMKKMLETEISRAFRSKKKLSLIMLDVDYFKKYNDSYGHVEGDNCLVEISDAIRSVVGRGPDIASRYGGEEFLIILPETEKLGAIVVAKRIKKVIDDLKILHKSSEISQYVTVSMGVTCVKPEFGNEINDVIEEVDHALYSAKEKGRNRIVSSIASI